MARDLLLAELTGAHLHVAHVSTAGAVAHVREATRARRARDGGGHAAPPHAHRRGHARLRPEHEDGAAAARRTTWRPASRASRTARSTRSPPTTRRTPCTRRRSSSPPRRRGCLGFETALRVVLELVRSGALTPLQLVASLALESRARDRPAAGPARARRAGGRDVLHRPRQRWVYDPAKGFSKSRNSPWAGRELHGRVLHTVVNGRLVYQQDVECSLP